MANIRQLKDKNDEVFYPQTHTKAVVDSNGNTVNDLLGNKQEKLTFDTTPTASSTNPVTSGGVKAALDSKANQSTTYTKTEVDNRLQMVQDVVNQAQLEIGAVPSDITPTEGSTNWVTSGGVHTALDSTIYKVMGSNQFPYVEIDLSPYQEQDCSIGTNKWYMAGTGAQRHIAIPVTQGDKYYICRIQNSEEVETQLAWLSSSYNPPYSNNNSIPFATGQTERLVTKGEVTVPEGASYLAITTVDGAGIVYNNIVKRLSDTFNIQTELSAIKEDVSSISNIQEHLDNVDSFIDEQYFKKTLELSEGTNINYFINRYYNWESSTTYTGTLFDMSGSAGGQISITKNPNGPCRVAFLVNNSTSGTPSYCVGYSSYIEQSTAESITYDIPIDCNFIYVYTNSNGTNVTPTITLRKLIINSLLKITFKKTEDIDISELEIQACALGSNGWYLVSSSPTMAHVALSVTPGDIYKVSCDSGGYVGFVTNAYNPPYTNNQAVPYVSGYNRILTTSVDRIFTIPNNTAYLILTTVDGSGSVKTYNIEKGIFVKQEKSIGGNVPTKLRVCHWNVGHFALGTGSDTTITHDDYVTMRTKWVTHINGINADIMLCCEYNANFVNTSGDNSAITARTAIFPSNVFKYAYIGTKYSYNMQSIFTNKSLSNIRMIQYTHKTQTRYYYVGDLKIGDKTVEIVETHLDFNDLSIRTSQIQELIDAFSNYDYVIIGGDWNISNTSEYDAFANAGYNMINHGYLGDLPTCPAGSDVRSSIDNIICKGFTINGIHVVNDAELSDHCAIYADFTLIDNN